MVKKETILLKEKIPREELLYKEFLTLLFWAALILGFSVFWAPGLPPGAGESGVPFETKAPWIFLALQEGLKVFPPLFWGVILPLALILILAGLPFLKGPEFYKRLLFLGPLILLVLLTLWGFYS